ncbi:MAG: NAD-dependent epimerase/dehydratase family protein [Melioribacteraceae bacterium]|nr:NAD-dependent epimerase/dehydratase family protein [Melioribacteraceae bacterium]
MDKVNLCDKRVLVTGGNGYLGKNLIQQLGLLEAKVFCLDIHDHYLTEGIEYVQIDLRNEEELKKFIDNIQPEIIYHLAASLDRTRDFETTNKIFDINVSGTINLLNALKDLDYENLIYTSTSEVYGGNQIAPPYKEDCNFVPASPYSLSKYMAEMAIRTFSELYDKNFVILRLFNFYGKDMPHKFFLPELIDKLKKDENFDMTAGEQKRDFIHISDVLNALVISSKQIAYKQVFNVCSGRGITIKDLAIELRELLKSKSKINFGALPYRNNEVWEMVGDNSKISAILNFKPNKILYKLI